MEHLNSILQRGHIRNNMKHSLISMYNARIFQQQKKNKLTPNKNSGDNNVRKTGREVVNKKYGE